MGDIDERVSEAVPPEPFRAWLRAAVPGLSEDVTVEPLSGGASNLTFRVRVGGVGEAGGHDWVLRRPPLGQVLATANDMTREHTVQRALAGTDVPVPRIVAWCDDDRVIGAPFYLMEWLDGVVYSDAETAAHLTESEARAASHGLVDVLARLHTVDPAAVGLADFGRPRGFLERQLRRWATQWERSTERHSPDVESALAALADRLPPGDRTGIVHGDYSFNNVMYARRRPAEVLAVLDWEMSTVGDPLTDVGMLLTYWGEAGEIMWRNRAPQAHRGNPGYPPAGELASRYAAATGTDVADLTFYVALATIKLAVISEGAARRLGTTSPERAAQTRETVDALAALALQDATTRS
jgi:aminoglycoside phosphotransferase (APT) family kinase protein